MKELKLRKELNPFRIDSRTWYYLEGNKVTLCKQTSNGVETIVLYLNRHIKKWFIGSH